MMPLARFFIKHGFRLYDRLYRTVFGLRAVGPILYVGRSRYRGHPRVFHDGTSLYPGEPMGTLHLDNARIAELYDTQKTPRRVPLAFGRLLLASFKSLAAKARVDQGLKGLPVYVGINWFRPRGKRFGFQAESLAAGPRCYLLRWHFRLLLYAFAPGDASWKIRDIEPHAFWLTRRGLMKHFAQERSEDDSPETTLGRRPGVPGIE